MSANLPIQTAGLFNSKLDAKAIVSALTIAHRNDEWKAPEWVVFAEMRVGVGWGKGAEQRIDLFAISCYAGLERIAYEVKISRSDFLHEIKRPLKRRVALAYSNRFYFATPRDLVKVSELPPECGLVEVDEDGKRHVVVEAPYRDSLPPSWSFVASFGRRVLAIERAG